MDKNKGNIVEVCGDDATVNVGCNQRGPTKCQSVTLGVRFYI